MLLSKEPTFSNNLEKEALGVWAPRSHRNIQFSPAVSIVSVLLGDLLGRLAGTKFPVGDHRKEIDPVTIRSARVSSRGQDHAVKRRLASGRLLDSKELKQRLANCHVPFASRGDRPKP